MRKNWDSPDLILNWDIHRLFTAKRISTWPMSNKKRKNLRKQLENNICTCHMWHFTT